MGTGRACSHLNEERICNTEECHPCTIDNGGCSPYANCELDEAEEVNCTCKVGFEGDGKTCKEKFYDSRI